MTDLVVPFAATPQAPTALTGPQKVAVILMQMEQSRAATVMQQFSELQTVVISP